MTIIKWQENVQMTDYYIPWRQQEQLSRYENAKHQIKDSKWQQE